MRQFLSTALAQACLACVAAGYGAAQTAPAAPSVSLTADQDHQNMMDQLGIKALRPGPSGNEKAPNHANYDESKANPFPDLPDPLTHERRPEGDDGKDVVGPAPAGDRGDVFEVCLWPRARRAYRK